MQIIFKFLNYFQISLFVPEISQVAQAQRFLLGAKDSRPPGAEGVWVSGRVAKLTFDRLGNADFEQSLSMA